MRVQPLPHAAQTGNPATKSLLRRRIVDPIRALLTQGVTPEKITQTLAISTVCSMFPILGTTTLLNFLVGLRLRMNQPIMQTLNQLLGPLHLVMIIIYIRLGETIWGAADERITIARLTQAFKEQPFTDFLHHFGQAGLHAITAWMLTAPVLWAVVYFPVRAIMRKSVRASVP